MIIPLHYDVMHHTQEVLKICLYLWQEKQNASDYNVPPSYMARIYTIFSPLSAAKPHSNSSH